MTRKRYWLANRQNHRRLSRRSATPLSARAEGTGTRGQQKLARGTSHSGLAVVGASNHRANPGGDGTPVDETEQS